MYFLISGFGIIPPKRGHSAKVLTTKEIARFMWVTYCIVQKAYSLYQKLNVGLVDIQFRCHNPGANRSCWIGTKL